MSPYGCLFTYIATDKINIADINYEAGVSGKNTTQSPREDINSVVYFPKQTLSYEAIGIGSDISLIDGSPANEAWENAEKVIDGDITQTATILKLGEDNALKIKLKLPVADPPPEDTYLVNEVHLVIKNITTLKIRFY